MSDLVTKLSDLIPDFEADVPQAEPGFVLKALRTAAREFCILTEAWRVELEAVDIAEDVLVYKLPVKAEAAVHRILWVKIDSEDETDERLYRLSANGLNVEIDEDITPTRDITDGLDVKVVLRPFKDTDEYDEWFLDKHAEAIVDGAKAVLLGQRKMPWYDPNERKRFQSMYNRGKALARRENFTENKGGSIKMKPAQWL